MLTIQTSQAAPRCDGVKRRDFLRIGSLGLGGLSLAHLMDRGASAAGKASYIRDKSIVLLFLAGGPSQYETFDPKPDGFDTFTSIAGHLPTSLPGVRFASYFPQLARRANKLTIVRSLVAKTANHAKASKNMLTGGVEDPEGKENAPVTNPSLGSIVCQGVGASDPVSGMPTYAFVPPLFDQQAGLKVSSVNPGVESGILGSGPGQLGAAYAPFNPHASDGWTELLKPRVPLERLDARRELLSQFDALRRRAEAAPMYRDLDAMHQQAYDVLLGGAIREVLDLSQEDAATLRKYDTSFCPIYNWNKENFWEKEGPSVGFPLGKQLLLARRCCEAGSRFVTVVHSNWDMHGGASIWGMKDGMELFAPPLDHAVAAFMDDVEERGLSKDILLVVVGEFGRSSGINKVGGREHNPDAGIILFAGGGLPHGQVIGSTDRRGSKAVEDIVTVEDLCATLMHYLFDIGTLRISPNVPPALKRLALDHGQPLKAFFS